MSGGQIVPHVTSTILVQHKALPRNLFWADLIGFDSCATWSEDDGAAAPIIAARDHKASGPSYDAPRLPPRARDHPSGLSRKGANCTRCLAFSWHAHAAPLQHPRYVRPSRNSSYARLSRFISLVHLNAGGRGPHFRNFSPPPCASVPQPLLARSVSLSSNNSTGGHRVGRRARQPRGG